MAGRVLPAIEAAMDRTIGLFSPRRELARRAARDLLRQRSTTYAAADSPRTVGGWSPVEAGVNDIIANSAQPVRARIRQLVRDFPYFARAVNVLCDYTVGTGITFQSAIRDNTGKIDHRLVTQTEDAFKFWADEADAGGRLHFYEIMSLAKRQDLESGEFIIVKRQLRDRSRYLPLALQMFEADWLTSQGARPAGRNRIHEGIEYDPSTGRTIACHFTDPDAWGTATRVLAEDIIHGFKTLRPGQLRGISEFAPGVLLARDLSTYMDTEIDAAKMAAKYLAFVQTPDVMGRQAHTSTNEQGQVIDDMENAIVEYLRPGEQVELASNPRPGGNFPPMVRLLLTMLAISTNVPYELLSGDYQKMNYSTGRLVRNDFRHSLGPVARRHIRQFCEPAKRAFFDAAVMGGKLPFRDYFTNPAPYLRAEWQPPGMESVDPARETKSMIDQVKSRLRSPQEIAAARGRDLEEIYREIKEAEDLAAEMGISVDLNQTSTALKNNPAALAKQDGDDDQGDQANA